MALRNFYITASADGRATDATLGPASKTGGVYIRIQQRHNGAAIDAVRIAGSANDDGTLTLRVYDGKSGAEMFKVITER